MCPKVSILVYLLLTAPAYFLWQPRAGLLTPTIGGSKNHSTSSHLLITFFGGVSFYRIVDYNFNPFLSVSVSEPSHWALSATPPPLPAIFYYLTKRQVRAGGTTPGLQILLERTKYLLPMVTGTIYDRIPPPHSSAASPYLYRTYWAEQMISIQVIVSRICFLNIIFKYRNFALSISWINATYTWSNKTCWSSIKSRGISNLRWQLKSLTQNLTFCAGYFVVGTVFS